MSEFVNTIDALGDDTVVDNIINRSITEFKDNVLTTLPNEAFNGCASLVEVDLPNVTNIGKNTFKNCSAMEKANFASLTALYQNTSQGCFLGCTSLKEINIPNVTILGSVFNNNMSGLFSNTAIERIILPKVEYIGRCDFSNCKNLSYVDLWEKVTLWGESFGGCTSLTTFIMRSSERCYANYSNIFNGTPIVSGTGYIYVPRELVDSYKTATNWSNFANQFRALEDFTVDGTITGELDETKI